MPHDLAALKDCQVDISGLHDLIGKEFEFGASGPDKYDCYNLCREVYRRYGKRLPEFESSDKPDIIHDYVLKGKELFTKLEKPEPMCLVMLKVHPKYVTHIGVVLNPPLFMHVMTRCRVVIERFDSIEWKRRVEGFYKPCN